jgi:RecA/RadA recombinase
MSNPKFAQEFLKLIKDKDTALASEDGAEAEFGEFIDTGSYSLNAVLSGTIYGGVPDNKVIAFAGESSTGKTFLVLDICKNFLLKYKNGIVLYFDTEAAVTKKMMEERGMDTHRVIISSPEHLTAFKEKVLKAIKAYEEQPAKKRQPLLIVLDSLGALPTRKEIEDTMKAQDKADMGLRARQIKQIFRVIRKPAAKNHIPILVTNHTYDSQSLFPTKEISGGSGIKYASDIIAMLGKRKEKEGNEVVGNVVHVKMYKSRLSKENAQIDIMIDYRAGLLKYYGLLAIAEKHGIIKKDGKKYELPNGEKVFGKQFRINPESCYTQDVLNAINEAVAKEFTYGGGIEFIESEADESDDEDEFVEENV